MTEESRFKTSRDLLSRARGEYLEMPGLSLTVEQAQRLWALDRGTCSGVLSNLVGSGFLRQRRDGSYIRQGAGDGRNRPEGNEADGRAECRQHGEIADEHRDDRQLRDRDDKTTRAGGRAEVR